VPYALFSTIPGSNPLPYTSTGLGEPADAPLGFGEPSVFVHQEFVALGPAGVGTADDTTTSRNVGASLNQLIDAIGRHEVGPDYRFHYFSSDARVGATINWFPDFPGCDAVGDPGILDPQFGYSAVTLEFEVYQRSQ
jgi:hypothetical protein